MSEDILRRWYKAHKTAEENPKLLIKNVTAEESAHISKLCSDRMEECFAADVELLKLENIPLVNLFKESTANRPKCNCTLTARRSNHHPECWRKLKEWFAYREALMVFVFEHYIRDTEYMKEYAITDRLRAEDIVEDLLTRFNSIPVVGDKLEEMSVEDYDVLEEDITDLVARELRR